MKARKLIRLLCLSVLLALPACKSRHAISAGSFQMHRLSEEKQTRQEQHLSSAWQRMLQDSTKRSYELLIYPAQDSVSFSLSKGFSGRARQIVLRANTQRIKKEDTRSEVQRHTQRQEQSQITTEAAQSKEDRSLREWAKWPILWLLSLSLIALLIFQRIMRRG